MIFRQSSVTDEYDRPVPGAEIYIYNQDGTPASITSDGTTALAQPLPTDEFGMYSYWADEGIYREDTWYGGRLRFREMVGIGSPLPVTVTANTAATRSDLAQVLDPTNGMTLAVSEPGREGVFVFDVSDLSAQVAADTEQGIYVAPSINPTGASGAWVC